MTALFVDVSYHDWDRRGGALDWAAIAGAGLGGVMCARASYGDPHGFNPPSPRFPEYMTGARAAGYTARGAYHNLTKGDAASINRQVDLLRSTMDRHGATWAMADIEAYPELVTRGLVSDWATVWRFHDRWYAVETRRMAWYIGRGFWSGHLGSATLTGLRGPLIGPRYPGVTGAPATAYASAGGDSGNGWTPYGGRTPDIWQYASTVTVPGASSRTDVNAYRGSLAALVTLLSGAPAAALGSPTPKEAPMFLAILGTTVYMCTGGVYWPSPDGATVTRWRALTPPPPEMRVATETELRRSAGRPLSEASGTVTLTPDHLAAIKAAAAAGVTATVPAIVDALVARLPADAMSRDDVEAAVRNAFAGGLAPVPPAAAPGA